MMLRMRGIDACEIFIVALSARHHIWCVEVVVDIVVVVCDWSIISQTMACAVTKTPIYFGIIIATFFLLSSIFVLVVDVLLVIAVILFAGGREG
jgi:hypothetical protein